MIRVVFFTLLTVSSAAIMAARINAIALGGASNFDWFTAIVTFASTMVAMDRAGDAWERMP